MIDQNIRDFTSETRLEIEDDQNARGQNKENSKKCSHLRNFFEDTIYGKPNISQGRTDIIVIEGSLNVTFKLFVVVHFMKNFIRYTNP